MNLIHSIYEPPGDGPHPTLLTLHGFGASADCWLAPHLCGGHVLGRVSTKVRLQVAISDSMLAMLVSDSGAGPLMSSGPCCQEQYKDVSGRSFETRMSIDPKALLLWFQSRGVMAYSLGLSEPERYAG